MKRLLSILLSISLIFVLCSCGTTKSKEGSKSETITAKEGNQPGTVIIGDYILTIIGTPHYETVATNQYGHYGHSLSVTLQITNNGNDVISFDDLADMGLSICGYDGDTCVGELVEHGFSGINSGETKQFTIYDNDPSYGSSRTPPDHVWGNTFDITIEFNGEEISHMHYDN